MAAAGPLSTSTRTHLECVMATFGLVGVSSAYEQDFFRQFGHNADMVLTFGLQNERRKS